MRRLLLPVVVLLTAVGTAAGGANPHDPQKRFTTADQAWAKRASIVRDDLPGGGWKATKASNDSATCRSFNPDESKLIETGERLSPDYSRAGGLVASASSVYRSASDAQASWKLETKPAILACFDEGFKQASASGMRVTILARGRLAFPQLAPRTTAFRVLVRYDVQRFRIPAVLDVVLLGSGRVNAAARPAVAGRAAPATPGGPRASARGTARRAPVAVTQPLSPRR